jgi:hypothetical protein
MSGLDPQHELTRLERFASLIREDNVDADKLDAAQLGQYLKDNKVDMAGPQKRFDAVLKKAKARRQLELARQQRLQAGEKAQQLLSAGSVAIEAVKKHVRGIIERMREHDPDQAQVYAREFEKATPEDLKTLEEDLMLLEMDQPDDGSRDKQDSR